MRRAIRLTQPDIKKPVLAIGLSNPMRIKKFKVYYGGYFDGHTEVFKKGRDLFYYSCDFPIPPPRDFIPESALRVTPSSEQWDSFVKKVKPFTSKWKKEYWAPVCDGTQWEVNIIVDELHLKSWGSNDFPEDFEQFMKIVSELTGVKSLGEDWLE